VERRLVLGHLGIQGLFDTLAPLDARLALFYDAQQAVDVLQLMVALPEHAGVTFHLDVL